MSGNAAEKNKSTRVKRDRKIISYDSTDLSHPLPNGLICFCELKGSWHKVTILEKKKLSLIRDIKINVNLSQSANHPSNEVGFGTGLDGLPRAAPKFANPEAENAVHKDEQKYDFTSHGYYYYIHYNAWDRRMDEWVSRDRLSLSYEVNGVNMLYVADDHHDDGHHGNFTEEDIKAHEEATKVKNIDTIQIGKYSMTTWYYSPFPQEYNKYHTLYFCEFCLSYYGHKSELTRHQAKCEWKHPPGNEIYRSEETNVNICAFEVDGMKDKVYCQNLCYIAKMFLDHKTLEFDCSPFLFYVVCEYTDRGCHIVGYFSKEKKSLANYNLACILALPCHQKKGYGKFLISLSYELSKVEQKVGSPEKPISDLGQVAYQGYWSKVITDLLCGMPANHEISIDNISKITRITTIDIIDTLKHLKVLVWYKGKWTFSRTQLEYCKKSFDAVTKRRQEMRRPDQIYVRWCRSECLHWTPYFAKTKKTKKNE